MQLVYYLIALIAGTLMPTQASINNRLSQEVGNPILAAFMSFAVGTVALFLYILIAGIPFGNLSNAKNAPAIAWTGGLCGAFFVAASVFLLPRLGVALTFSIFILGQMLATLPIDHFGFLGATVREVNFPRIVGVLLVLLGVFLIRRF